MRSKPRHDVHVGGDVWQELGDKAEGSCGGITAVQQSCQSTGRGGCTQPTESRRRALGWPAADFTLYCWIYEDIDASVSHQGISPSLYYHSSLLSAQQQRWRQPIGLRVFHFLPRIYYFKRLQSPFNFINPTGVLFPPSLPLICTLPSARISSCFTHRPRFTLRLCAASLAATVYHKIGDPPRCKTARRQNCSEAASLRNLAIAPPPLLVAGPLSQNTHFSGTHT